jgi:drug/metabolite transporter (DMT)-like permease
MPVLLGLLVAASFGSGDFLGGTASRRVATLDVLGVVQVCALVGAVGYAFALGGHASGRDVELGALAGTLNVVALGCLYAGLATGRMGIVAPLTAMIAACIPVAWGLANGEDLGAVSLLGVALAISAAGLVARERSQPEEQDRSRALALALGAGLLFGGSLVLYSETSHESGGWPVLAGRGAAAALVLVVVVGRRRSLRFPPPERTMAVAAGVLDVTATSLLLVALREGLVALVAPVAAFGPAFTVMWAWLILREPIGRVQLAGIVVGIVGLVMIATG